MTDEQAAGPVPDGASFDAGRWIVSRGGLTVTARVFSGRVVHTVRPPTPQGADEEAALDYMSKLHENNLNYTKSGSAPGRNAGAGEVAVAIVFSHDCINNIENAGMTDLVVSFPSEGTGYEIAGQAIVAGAPHPNNAKTWYDWALTNEAQEIGPTVGAYQLPTNPDAEVSDKAVSLAEVNLVEYDFQAAGEARTRLTQRFEDEIAAAPEE